MVTRTASTVIDPSLTRMEDRRSSGRTPARRRTSASCRRIGLLIRFAEGVADPVHRPDVAGLGGLVAELAADAGDVAVDDAPPGVVPVAPDPFHQLLPGEH